jgi:RimJ/RimL family protein N-acetyltransferase
VAVIEPPGREACTVTLRNVELGDAEIYVRLRCDPIMMAELGGPQSREDVLAKHLRDVATAEADQAWILMVIPEATAPAVAGCVVVWTHSDHGAPVSEIGWMVLPGFQGRGVAKSAVTEVLHRARTEDRWGVIHAFPQITNGPSNGVCRSLGFDLLGQEWIEFAGSQFHSNHWAIDPQRLPDSLVPTR